MEAILFISHGSKAEKSRRENETAARLIRLKSGVSVVEYAFLEADRPDISEGIRRCVEQGADRIIVLLNFLNTGRHVAKDIPAILEQEKRKYPRLTFILTPPVGTHPRISELFLEMIEDARAQSKK